MWLVSSINRLIQGKFPSRTRRLGLDCRLSVSEHRGYAKHDPAGRDGTNARNGARTKTVLSDIAPAEVAMPRERDGSFEPQIVRKRQRRLSVIDSARQPKSLRARPIHQLPDSAAHRTHRVAPRHLNSLFHNHISHSALLLSQELHR